MLKLLLLSVLVAVALSAKNVCRLTKGKNLIAFSGTKEQIKFGCKFNAVKGTRCGNYKSITVTPDLAVAKKGKTYVYVLESMYVGIVRNDDEDLGVRMDMRTVGKYLNGTKDDPINRKTGSLNITDVYEITGDGKKLVTLKEKRDEAFVVTYELYDNKDPKTSEMSFTCYDDKFEPNDFPDQLCGNGTLREVRETKEKIGVKGNRRPVIVHSVFTNPYITQTDDECEATADKMSSSDCDKMEVAASTQCWKLTYQDKFVKCLYDTDDDPVHPNKAFRACVDFVCSNYTDTSSCSDLKGYLEDHKCPKLKPLNEKFDSVC